MRPEMEEHEEHCLFERSLCENCQSIIVKGDRINHNCITVINNKISKLESLVKEIAKKLEDPKEDSFDERKATMCFRHEFIQDYSLEFSIYHPSVNHYQITLPVQSLLVTPEARCVILRVLVHDCSVSKLFSRCSIRQAGESQGVNLSNYIMPMNGIPLIFEVLLPWSGENPAQIAIEWERSPHSYYLGHSKLNDRFSLKQRSTSPIPVRSSEDPQASLTLSGSISDELTHGIIYIGIAGYME